MKVGFPLTEKTEKRTVCEDRISVSIKTKERFDKSPTTHAMTRQGQGVCRGKRRNKPPVTASRARRLGPKSRDRRAKWQMPQVEGTKNQPEG